MNKPIGRNFLMTPGPTTVPDRVLAAMHRPAVDLMDPAFVELAESCFEDLRRVFKTSGEVFIYAANGHGAWEAALRNTLRPGDLALAPVTGVFSWAWGQQAATLGAEIEELPSDWRHPVDPAALEARLRADEEHRIRAILFVQTDTATSITSDVLAARRALDACGHPALLMVDVVASLGATDFRMDEWGVDVAVGASQKALMAPPGLSFTAVSERALAASTDTAVNESYWSWQARRGNQFYMRFCGTPSEHLMFALREAIDMLFEEGLDAVFARHLRLANATRAAVSVWAGAGSLDFNALDPACRANSVTTIRMADGYSADAVRFRARDDFNVALGGGLGPLEDRAFRIGHMGWLNEPTLLGALAAVEASMIRAGVPFDRGGVDAAIRSLAATTPE